MNRCFSALRDLLAGGQPCVLVTVAHIAGSAPREAGARMIVTSTNVTGTIGGGNLEFEAQRIARARLEQTACSGSSRFIELFPLGSMLQQCCGGAVFLHFETFAHEPPGWLEAAADLEQGNARALLASRIMQPQPLPSSLPRDGVPGETFPHNPPPAETSPPASAPNIETGEMPTTDKLIVTDAGAQNSRGSLGDKCIKNYEKLATDKLVITGAGDQDNLGNERINTEEIPAADNLVVTGAGAQISQGSLGDERIDELAARKADELLRAQSAPKTAVLHSLIDTQSTLPDTSDALFFEIISPCDFRVALFGAGHVGRALVNALANATDCRITWVDSRTGQFPPAVPDGVETRFSDDPVAEVENLPEQAYCLVMTHNHQLDQDLCEALLHRGDFAFLGLIGSATKQRRFEQRLRDKGISEQQLARLTCPIGIPGIESKEPGVIAVSVAAQLLHIRSANDTASPYPEATPAPAQRHAGAGWEAGVRSNPVSPYPEPTPAKAGVQSNTASPARRPIAPLASRTHGKGT